MFYALVAMVLLGDQISTSDLTPTQEAEVRLKVAEYLESNQKDTSAQKQIDKAKQYAELGQQVGVALVATAKELGIAVEDFSHTTVGKITIGVIVWKLMGREFLRAAVAIPFLIIGVMMWRSYFNKMCVVRSITYHQDGKIAEITHFDASDCEGTRFMMLFILIGILTAGMLIMLL
jgi:hypothetical protein